MKIKHLLFTAALVFTFAIIGFSQGVMAKGQVNQKALDELIKKAAEYKTSALVVYKDGKLITEWYEQKYKVGEFLKDKPALPLMSCTKSITSLGIGRLIDQGKIKSLDQPVYEFYPEWKQGKKEKITIRHLLNHTSGLQIRHFEYDIPDNQEIYQAPDVVQFALAAEIVTEPGEKFEYNNKAVNLLAGIIKKASGKRMDLYFKDEIFKPMNIKQLAWEFDKAGNTHVMAGLSLTAIDFAKFGTLILNKGLYNNQRIVSEKWVEESLNEGGSRNKSSGLLWWRMIETSFVVDEEQLKKLETAGVKKDILEKLLKMKDKPYDKNVFTDEMKKIFVYPTEDEFYKFYSEEFTDKGVNPFSFVWGKVKGYEASGALGQRLLIYPESNLIVVRFTDGSDLNQKAVTFSDIRKYAAALVQ
jgi:CubicO group peptidase (beta-lactamase class C family)